MSGGVNQDSRLADLKQALSISTDQLLSLLDISEEWLNVERDGSDREEAYSLIYNIREYLVEILGLIHDPIKNLKDSDLSDIGSKLAVKGIEKIYSALNFDNEPALIFSSELTSILFLLQPYLNEVTLRRYGGMLYSSGQMCNKRLKMAREGKIKSELVPLFISIQGFYSAYTHA